jgi:heme-degrading monooxygenase HmoA
MLTIARNKSVFAEIGIFSTEPEQQQLLLNSLQDYVKTLLKQQLGFLSAAIHRSRDELRVVNYVQWKSQDSYNAYIDNTELLPLRERLSAFSPPDSHLYDIFISEPTDSQMEVFKGMEGLINFGIFKLKNPDDQPRFIQITKEAVQTVTGQPGLITTHFHRSLDGARAVNYTQWRTQAEFEAMVSQPPFAKQLHQMQELAESEFQMSLYEVVYTEPA